MWIPLIVNVFRRVEVISGSGTVKRQQQCTVGRLQGRPAWGLLGCCLKRCREVDVEPLQMTQTTRSTPEYGCFRGFGARPGKRLVFRNGGVWNVVSFAVLWFRLAGGLRPGSALLRLREWMRRCRGSPFLKGFPFIGQIRPGAWFRVVANSQYLPGSSG